MQSKSTALCRAFMFPLCQIVAGPMPGLIFPVQTAPLKSRLHGTEKRRSLKEPALCLYILYTYIL